MVRAARTGHRLLYGLILYQGALGLIMAAYSPAAIRLFDGPNISALAEGNAAVLAALRPFHFAGAVVLAGLIIFHVAGALWHHFVRRDDVLIRMLPSGGLWQRLQAEEAAKLARFPSQRGANWPKRMPK
jgi:cytochrome b561